MNASEQITAEVTAWPGVEAGVGRRGEYGFRIGKRELGHLHGDRVAHFGFSKTVWAQLREQGRIEPHPVFPDRVGPAARRIESDEDVRDVIALLRLNYERAQTRPFDELAPSPPQLLPFGPGLEARAFVLRRDAGNLLLYSVDGLADEPVTRQYLNHWHEAMFASGDPGAPLFVHRDDATSAGEYVGVRASFSKRHTLDGDFEVIPIPGHTPGATAYLWDSGRHRFLFTGDTVFLKDGEWVDGLLESSDRDAYVRSLALLRELDFDVLVPWVASAGGPWFAHTDREDARRRLGELIERL